MKDVRSNMTEGKKWHRNCVWNGTASTLQNWKLCNSLIVNRHQTILSLINYFVIKSGKFNEKLFGNKICWSSSFPSPCLHIRNIQIYTSEIAVHIIIARRTNFPQFSAQKFDMKFWRNKLSHNTPRLHAFTAYGFSTFFCCCCCSACWAWGAEERLLFLGKKS